MHLLSVVALFGLAAIVPAAAAEPGGGWVDIRALAPDARALTTWAPCVALILAACVVLAQPRRLIGMPGRIAAVLAIGFALFWPALAFAQAAGSTTVNVGDIFGDFRGLIEGVIGIVVAGVLALLATLTKRNIGLSIDERRRLELHSAIMDGVHAGMDRVQQLAGTAEVDVRSQVLVTAIAHARTYAPAAIRHFGYGEFDLERIAKAKLAEVQPAAIKLATLRGQ